MTNVKPMSEEQAVHIVRNALLVAGQEMGNGDQWPAIKDTVHKIMKDVEDLKIERNVNAELKTHLYEQLRIVDIGIPLCTTEARAALEPKIKILREVFDAYFSDLDQNAIVYDESEEPEHIKRMKAIISTLGDENG